MNQKLRTLILTILSFLDVDRVVITLLIIFASINLFVQYSASDKHINYLLVDSFYLLLSFGLLLIVANLNINQIKSMVVPLYIISLLLLCGVLFFGVSVNGAKRWLNIGIRVQPSELLKLTLPLMLAYFFAQKSVFINWLTYIQAFILILIPFLLIAKQPDLGTGILVLTTGLLVLFFAGLSHRVIITFIVFIICCTPIIWHFLHDYQKNRILTLINPQSDPLGKGYHIIQGMIAIGSGGIWGKGYLHGTQTHLNFIPEKNTDFVVTVLSEEFGLIGILIILGLYLMLIFRGLKIASTATESFSQLVIATFIMSFTFSIVINMGMVAGIFPVVGVPLPFISYGGTSTLVLMLQFGIILAIKKQNTY